MGCQQMVRFLIPRLRRLGMKARNSQFPRTSSPLDPALSSPQRHLGQTREIVGEAIQAVSFIRSDDFEAEAGDVLRL